MKYTMTDSELFAYCRQLSDLPERLLHEVRALHGNGLVSEHTPLSTVLAAAMARVSKEFRVPGDRRYYNHMTTGKIDQ